MLFCRLAAFNTQVPFPAKIRRDTLQIGSVFYCGLQKMYAIHITAKYAR